MNFDIFIFFISLISFIFGILLLLYYAYLSQPIRLTPSNITEDFLGKRISISGKIIEVIKKEKVNYVIITDNIKNFTITIFPDVFKEIEEEINIGNKVEIKGILSIYKGRFQIILQNPNNIIIKNE